MPAILKADERIKSSFFLVIPIPLFQTYYTGCNIKSQAMALNNFTGCILLMNKKPPTMAAIKNKDRFNCYSKQTHSTLLNDSSGVLLSILCHLPNCQLSLCAFAFRHSFIVLNRPSS